MDWRIQKEPLIQGLKKYRHMVLVLLIGMVLMLMPAAPREAESVPMQPIEEASLQESLERILCHLEGAGKVKVLLTESTGGETQYQTDSDRFRSEENQEERLQTVVEGDTGLVRRVDPPSYRGAVVLAQGADNAQVRLSLVEAVADATGLPTNCITVLKMK